MSGNQEMAHRWLDPPEGLTLASDEVHVWQAALVAGGLDAEALARLLSPDEMGRADRFRFAEGHNRFVVARGLLRVLLGRYLGAGPAELRFRYGPHGKPGLDAPHEQDLRFNLSHSGNRVLYAFTRGREVGIDVEAIRWERDHGSLAERFFAPAEAAALRALPAPARLAAFYAGWTRKEAYMKARGTGIALGLSRFQVSLAPDEPAALLHVEGEPDEPARWSLTPIDAGPGYAAALAVEGAPLPVCCWRARCGWWERRAGEWENG